MKILIACSGNGSRWDNYMNIPKHLININGEILLHRTVRLIKKVSDLSEIPVEICIVSFEEGLYKVDETTLIKPNIDSFHRNAYFGSPFLYVSKDWWSKDDVTVILFGDVYFTEEAMNTILKTTSSSYLFFGREKGSSITGGRWGEIFAISFVPEFHKKLCNVLDELKKMKDCGILQRFLHWEIYRKLQSINLFEHRIKGNFIEINDFTEDFDDSDDYNDWIMRWNSRSD
jgi:hypothetical protein